MNMYMGVGGKGPMLMRGLESLLKRSVYLVAYIGMGGVSEGFRAFEGQHPISRSALFRVGAKATLKSRKLDTEYIAFYVLPLAAVA